MSDETLRVTSMRADDEDARIEAGQRPRTLDEYIGQDRVRENLHVSITAARQRREGRRFMTSALAVDGSRGPDLPAEFNRRTRQASDEHLKSPLPPAWSDATRELREFAEELGLIEN